VTSLTIPQDSVAIENKWLASDVTAFELCPPHAGAYPLDDQVAFGASCDRPDDDDNSTAQGPTGVDLFAEADELDVQPVQFVEHIQEVFYYPTLAIRSDAPDQDNIESAAGGHRSSWHRDLGRLALDPLILSVYSSTIW